MSTSVKSIRGMHDVLPGEIASWHLVEDCVRQVMHSYDYREIRTPIVERTALFHRSIGEVTDIVEKEMYTFPDRKNESLSLRPEATASCVRAALEHGLLQPGQASRIWYQGPMFRYERPQKGRNRQFHQVGAEVYGVAGPAIEAELILLSARLWRLLGISDLVQLEINTLGSTEDRASYRTALVNYFNDCLAELDEDSLRRLHTNPLRILDSKNPAMARVLSAAPGLQDYLSYESAEHFDQLKALLSTVGIAPVINRRLVRGLDYYSHTVFEWTTDKLGAQSAVCAGGRYDGLIEQLGGKATPGVGWAMGLERLIGLLDTLRRDALQESPDAFLIVAEDVGQEAAIVMAEWLRDTIPHLGLAYSSGIAGSIKSQFKRADKSGAPFAVIFGANEQQSGSLSLKSMRDDTPQQTASREEIAELLKQAIQN